MTEDVKAVRAVRDVKDVRSKLDGLFAPNTTVFSDEVVDYARIEENIARYNQTGLRGYMPLGSNGEFASLTDREGLRIVGLYARKKSADKTLLVGASRESVYKTVEFIKKVADRGGEFASVLPPHYFATDMDEETLIRYFTGVADSSPIPILMYNAPKFCAGVTITTGVVSECAQHPNIVAMKDTSAEDVALYVDAIPEGANFFVLVGTISKFFYGVTVGAIGGVVSIANYVPDRCVQLHALYLSGNIEEGRKMDVFMRDLSRRAAGKYGVAGVKAAMDMLGYHGGAPRLPLVALNAEQREELRAVLVKENVLCDRSE